MKNIIFYIKVCAIMTAIIAEEILNNLFKKEDDFANIQLDDEIWHDLIKRNNHNDDE